MHGAQRAEKWPGLEQAIASGYSVIPTRSDEKPSIPTWKPYQERRPTPDEILTWKSKNPAGWAIMTGKISGIVTLDFDGEPGQRTAKILRVEPHRRTPSGGFHIDFRAPDWRVQTLNGKSKRTLGKKWPGLDIRADGGYAIFTGRTDKGEYRPLRDPQPYALDVLPSDLRLFLGLERQVEEKGRNRVDANKLIDRALTKVLTEGRNNAGFWLCGQLRDNGYVDSEAEKWMRTFASRCPATNTKGQPEPYGESEILATNREVFSRPAREPWGGEPTNRFVFILNESGLYVHDSHGEKAPYRISPPIHVLARARDSRAFVDIHGHAYTRARKQREFLKCFEELGMVVEASRRAKVSRSAHYVWMKDPVYQEMFWEARRKATQRLEDEAVRRARYGVSRIVLYKGKPVMHRGKPIVETEYSDQLLIKLLEAGDPDRFNRQKVASLEDLDFDNLTAGQIRKLIEKLRVWIQVREAKRRERMESNGKMIDLKPGGSTCEMCPWRA